MKKVLLLLAIVFFTGFTSVKEINNDITISKTETMADSSRIEELDKYCNNLAKTVAEGDFESYSEGYLKMQFSFLLQVKTKLLYQLKKH